MRAPLLAVLLLLPLDALAQPIPAPTPTPTETSEITPSPPDEEVVSEDKKGPNHDACLTAVRTLDVDQAESNDPEPCTTLALVVRDQIRLKKTAGPTAATVEPEPTDTAGTQDTAGQAAAVASGEPVAQSGGTIGLQGTPNSGLSMIAALAVNPIGASADESDYKRYGWGSRAADISFVVPVNLDANGVVEEGLQYFGAHVRLNIPWLINRENSKLVKEAEKAFGAYLAVSSDFIEAAAKLLQGAADPKACAEAIIGGSIDAQDAACGGTIATDTMIAGFMKSSKALADAREDASKWYLTVEARTDVGDVNGDAATTRDSLLAAYASGGMRYSAGQIRVRAGIGSFNDGATDMGHAVYFGAAGLEYSQSGKDGRLALSLGIEGQTTSAGRSSPTGTRYANFRVGLRVPVAEGKAVSIGIAKSLDDPDIDPVVTVNADWATLFGNPKGP
jgi:hypothetical protein